MHGRAFGHSAVPKYILFLGLYVYYILCILSPITCKTRSDANLHFFPSIAGGQTQTCGYFWKNHFGPIKGQDISALRYVNLINSTNTSLSEYLIELCDVQDHQ